ncbi:MAG: CDP-glucose 4,6-dehydratase [Candidatus Marinimicrobia bacterium]|nr:CDP-glucose 4,6-dehydratase [Candidatus Neomarinimicrobiota bacterium]|tara:strand:- start:1509 stop:2609 length:1101 start_codon:yes stop_codon:yes gene_type:complete
MRVLFNNEYQNKKVFITGHTGFKGAWLSYWLSQLGAKVIGFSNHVPTNPSLFKILKLDNIIDHHIGDVRDLDDLLSIMKFKRPDYIFHLAAQSIVEKSYFHPTQTMTTNIIGVNNILDAVRIIGKKCNLIIVTSDKCYDNMEIERGYIETDSLGGKDPYGASKAAAELIVKAYYHSFFKSQDLIKVSTVRAGNVIGGGDWAIGRIIPDCIRAWEKNQRVKIRNPRSTRPWQHVLEPLSGYLHLGQLLNKNNFNGRSYNFGPLPKNDHTVLDLIKKLNKRYFNNNTKAYELVKESFFSEAKLLKLDCSKAKEELNWQPNLDFENTVKLTADWYSKYQSSDIKNLNKLQIDYFCKIAYKNKAAWIKSI